MNIKINIWLGCLILGFVIMKFYNYFLVLTQGYAHIVEHNIFILSTELLITFLLSAYLLIIITKSAIDMGTNFKKTHLFKKLVFLIFGVLLLPLINAENETIQDVCEEKWGDWDCSDWSKCNKNDIQTRECILDNEECLVVEKPIEKQECECEPNWFINEGCIDGTWYIDYIDLNDCEDSYSEVDNDISCEEKDLNEVTDEDIDENVDEEEEEQEDYEQNNKQKEVDSSITITPLIKDVPIIEEKYYCGKIGEEKLTDKIGTDCDVVCERLWTKYWHKSNGDISKGNVIINGTSRCIFPKQIEIKVIKKESFIDFIKRIFNI